MVLIDPGLCGMASLSNIDFPRLQGMQYVHDVFKPRSSLMVHRRLAAFLGGRPIVLMLCLDSTLLMWLKVGPTGKECH